MQRSKLLLAMAIFVVGLVVAGRALYRGAPSDSSEPLIPTGLTAATEAEFSQTGNEVAATPYTLQSALLPKIRGALPADASPFAAEDIASNAARRLHSIFAGDRDAVERLRRDDNARGVNQREEDLTDESRHRASWPEVWSEARVDLNGATARLIPPLNSEDSAGYHLGSSLRSTLRGFYPDLDGDLPTLSVAIPAKISTRHGSGKKVAVHLALEYQPLGAGAEWAFVSCRVYTPDTMIVPPAY